MLAHKLVRYGIGGRTVQELSDTMDVDEFLRWAAFSSLEPLGDERADWREAAAMAQQHNIHRGKASAKSAESFLLRFRARDKEMDLREMELALMSQYTALGGEFPADGGPTG
jgi:hypothetical protein